MSAAVVVVCSVFLEVSAAGAFPLFEHAAKLRHIKPAVIAEIIRLFFILFVLSFRGDLYSECYHI